ncbi:MAG TPA: DUF2865 domain-containing protein [Devosia sp.]|nr:DUF2865 domain-containing protein [Devosia sp.]
MPQASTFWARCIALCCAVALFALSAGDASAQSQNCQALGNTLRQLESSDAYQGSGDINDRLRDAQDGVQQAESQYVRDGCNAAAKAGQPLNAQCRGEARQVLQARANLKQVSAAADTGNQVDQQREAVLQDMARFNCDSRSNATVTQSPQRGNLFDQLFGQFEQNDDGNTTRGDQFQGQAGEETIRTVCVRKSDGYYWPVSFSTLLEYAPQDADVCQAQCPNTDVELYYYDNPGQDPDQMVNLQGQPYKSLPNAFAYRTKYDADNDCKAKVDYGTINLAALPDGTQRAMVSFDGQIFPLPVDDPRQTAEVTMAPVAAANYVDVPLPRPRPPGPGEAPKPVVVKQAATDPERIVMFGDKRVRIVGPDTPYAPTEAAGT